MKTFKREEIYANPYENLGHMRVNIEEFIEGYYNGQRLHSALGYFPPEEFEQQAELPESVSDFKFIFRDLFKCFWHRRLYTNCKSGKCFFGGLRFDLVEIQKERSSCG
jgi:hypothetical protein